MNEEKIIKTALELALEKTRGMRATREEMQALKKTGLKTRAKGLVTRYLEGEKTLRDIEKELSEAKEKDGVTLRSIIIEELLSTIEPGPPCDRAMEALTAIAREKAGTHVEKLRSVLHEFNKEYSEAKEKRSSALLSELKGKGIWGSALQPNIRDDAPWRALSQRIKARYMAQVDKLRTALQEP